MRLAIVGSRSLDGHPDALRVIRSVLDAYQARHAALVVVSGGAAGIDRMAAAEARRRGLEVIEHLPAGTTWRHYSERNLCIARDCDELVRIADPRSRTKARAGRGTAPASSADPPRSTRSPAGCWRPAGPRPPSCEGSPMPDADLIDPTLDRVWAVDATVIYTAYVVAETADEAERIAEDEAGDLEPDFTARELTEPLEQSDGDRRIVPYGRSRWEYRELTVNEAVELVASHQPVYDTETLLMPFADAPPPIYPPRIEDFLAARRSAR